jgi:glucosamine 6-phosphate synthetase-like amidotransferase/phosphosugar isomerase protein
MNYEYDYEYTNEVIREQNELLLNFSSAAKKEYEHKLIEEQQKFAHTIETLKKQVLAAMAEVAKAKQEANEWRKAYEDLAKCL